MSEEDEEMWSDWEKQTSADLKEQKKKLDSMEKDIAEIKTLVSKPLESKQAKEKPRKPTKKTVKELISKSIPFLGDFNPQKFVELAQAEGLIRNENFTDEDIKLLSDAIGEPLLILDEAEREEAIELLCEKLNISKERFESITKEEEILLPVDEGFYEEEEEQSEEEVLPSKITVVERKVSEEEAEEEEE